MSAVLVKFPSEVIEEIDRIGGEGNRTSFLVDMAKSQILKRRQIEAVQAAAGAWTEDENAEWFGMDSAQYVDMIRNRDRQSFELAEVHRQEP